MLARKRDQVAAREGPRQPHGGGRDVRAVLGELDHLRARDQLDQPLGDLELERRGAGEVRAQRDLLASTASHDPRVGVAEHDRAQPHAPVDELAAVGIPDPATLATGR